MTSLTDRLTQLDIRFTATRTDRNPHMQEPRTSSEWHASHWRCTLSRNGARMTVYFSMGSAHTQPPTLADVLDCIASDAAGYENGRGFIDWCGDYGYDTDSRTAERTYKIIGRQAASLKRLLGPANYEALLFDTECA